MITYNDALAYCKKNGKKIDDIKDSFEVINEHPLGANVTVIRSWNVSGLAKPTDADIAALTQAEKDDAITELDAPFYKKQKIDLKMTIDAGNALSLDMSKEQGKFDEL